MIEVPGQGKRPMSPPEIVEILSHQQNQIKFLINRIKELENDLLHTKMNVAINKPNYAGSTL